MNKINFGNFVLPKNICPPPPKKKFWVWLRPWLRHNRRFLSSLLTADVPIISLKYNSILLKWSKKNLFGLVLMKTLKISFNLYLVKTNFVKIVTRKYKPHHRRENQTIKSAVLHFMVVFYSWALCGTGHFHCPAHINSRLNPFVS